MDAKKKQQWTTTAFWERGQKSKHGIKRQEVQYLTGDKARAVSFQGSERQNERIAKSRQKVRTEYSLNSKQIRQFKKKRWNGPKKLFTN